VGAKGEWLDRRLYADVTAFYMKRTDMQVSASVQLVPGDPNSYLFFTDNASGGRNLGLETSARFRVTARWELGATLGLLYTRYSGYGDDDRDQAQAPEYQASLSATWRHPQGWMARADVVAVDDFYFDVPPIDVRSNAYAVMNLKAGYEAERWSVYAWVRNLFDEDYAVRGFFFGNEPPDFVNKRYVQLGEPRVAGITARWEF
jgi:outer membrane receptor protein involved in Fe transport